MNRNDLRRLVRVRLREARVLIEARCYDGGYYLCGYAVACGLKSCIARQTRQHDFPDRERATRSYTHDLERLVEVAGLTALLNQEKQQSREFFKKWNTVKDWSEASRYATRSRKEARALYRAVTDRDHGVMQWLRRYW